METQVLMDTNHLNMPEFSLDQSLYLDLLRMLTRSLPPAKFGGNPSSGFCVILLTNQQTYKQTWVKTKPSLKR